MLREEVIVDLITVKKRLMIAVPHASSRLTSHGKFFQKESIAT